jgi:hypothetical protein
MNRKGKIYKELPWRNTILEKNIIHLIKVKGDTPKLSLIRDAKYISWCQRFKFVKSKISN